MTKFAGMVSETSVSFTGINGGNHVISTGHPNNDRIRDLMRETQAAFRGGNAAEGSRLWQELTDLADIPAFIEKSTSGRVTVKDGDVYFDDEVLHNAITRRILWTIEQKYDPEPYMLFLDNLMDNPSKRAVEELFGFMEACNMGITEDGHLIAYKRVRPNYNDIHSNSISNAVGQKPSMRRNRVDDNKDRTCSQGLHFCSFSYLPHFSSGGNGEHVMILKLNPRDVVSIPSDYNDAKGRACLYEVIGEYEGDLSDVLSSKPVWKRDEVREAFGNDSYEHNTETTLDRLLRMLGMEEQDGDSTFLSEIPFSERKTLAEDIENEFDVTISDDFIDDDDRSLQELADEIDDERGVSSDDDEHDSDSDHDEIDEPADSLFAAAPVVPVINVGSSKPTVTISSQVTGSKTRWLATCPDCNGGAGWSQSYARKRDARRGIEREFGESVNIVERD